MGEFELIDAIVAELGSASTSASVVVGPGDDAAVLALPPNHQLVTSVDTLVADLHFPADAPAQLIAERALRVSVSDLAAMGAAPLAAVVALVLPKTTSSAWVKELSAGFARGSRFLGCPVTGGNLTSGQLSISVTVQGLVPEGAALLRSGAAAGHIVWVSGALGGAAFALTQPGLSAVASDVSRLTPAQQRYYLPRPQLDLGIRLRGVASSAIDISDGLAADLNHLAQHSGVDVQLTGASIPTFEGATLAQALHGGDDYELCFTAPEHCTEQVRSFAPDARAIGVCIEPVPAAASHISLDGEWLSARGFDHFAEALSGEEALSGIKDPSLIRDQQSARKNLEKNR